MIHSKTSSQFLPYQDIPYPSCLPH
jgi:hypothetical protein